MHDQIEAREYKLLLEAKRFGHAPSLEAANTFWDQRLKPIIDDHLDKPRRGSRYERQFDRTVERTIHFYDTENRLLDSCGYSLRKRASVKGKGRPEITLKLRLPDLFAVATAELPARDECCRSAIRGGHRAAGGRRPEEGRQRHHRRPAVDPQSLRAVDQPERAADRKAAHAQRRVPALSHAEGQSRGVAAKFPAHRRAQRLAAHRAALRTGSPRDRVQGRAGALRRRHRRQAGPHALAHARLGTSRACWRFPIPATSPTRPMTGPAARRAFRFFTGLQHDLGPLVNLRFTSKTELALALEPYPLQFSYSISD